MSVISVKGFFGVTSDLVNLSPSATGTRHDALVFLGSAVNMNVESTTANSTTIQVSGKQFAAGDLKVISTAVVEEVVVLGRLLGRLLGLCLGLGLGHAHTIAYR